MCNSGTARWTRSIGQGMGKGLSFCALFGHPTFLESPCVHQPISSLNPALLGIHGEFITKLWLNKSLVIAD